MFNKVDNNVDSGKMPQMSLIFIFLFFIFFTYISQIVLWMELPRILTHVQFCSIWNTP